MNKLTSLTQVYSSTQLSGRTVALPFPVRRLLVLIPDSVFIPSELAERIWQLSSSTHSQVLLLGLCPNPTMQLMLRRQLVTLAGSIRDNSVTVEILMETKKRWSKNVEQLWQPGDLVVGLAQKRGGCYHQELSEIQQSNLQIPVYILSDLHLESYEKMSFLSEAALWLGGSFWIQIQITHLPQNWGQTVLLCLSVFAEIAILWAWNLMLG